MTMTGAASDCAFKPAAATLARMITKRSFAPGTLPRWSAGALAVLPCVLLVACASAGRVMPPGQPTALRPGDPVSLPDAAVLRYIGVSADSRCRPDVQCVRAGDADVALEYTARGAAPRVITINTDAPAADIGEWRLRLLSLEFGASPRATLQVDRSAR